MAVRNSKGKTRSDINAAQRAAMAVKLRAQKLTYDEIAKRCGYSSKAACHVAVQRELDRTITANIEEYRREELSMLDQLHSEAWLLAMDRDNKNRTFAMDRVLAIAERRARLLGLDAPSGTNVFQVVVRETPPGYLALPEQNQP